MCPFYDPTLVKLEGHVDFGLSVCVCWGGCLLVGVYASWVVCRYVAGPTYVAVQICGWPTICGWLVGSVGHFFETLNGEC